jgi:hypothetical protein
MNRFLTSFGMTTFVGVNGGGCGEAATPYPPLSRRPVIPSRQSGRGISLSKMFRTLLTLLLLTGNIALCQTASNDSVSTFKVHKAAPNIKAIYSKANALYKGKNPLILEGVDTSKMRQYYLRTAKFIPITLENGRFWLDIGLYPIAHDIITIPGTVRVFIFKVNKHDTILIGQQELDIAAGNLPRPIVMVGQNILTPAKEPRKDLLANPSLDLVSEYSDYSSAFHITSFDITIGSITYNCKTNSLSNEALAALKKYKGRYVTINYVFVSTPDGISVPFVSPTNQQNGF